MLFWFIELAFVLGKRFRIGTDFEMNYAKQCIYIYIYIYMCVCVYIYIKENNKEDRMEPMKTPQAHTNFLLNL